MLLVLIGALWPRRQLKIVVRDVAHLSSTGRLVLDYLRAAEERVTV